MTSYLVTGGAGFIGSHIAQSLLQNYNKVRILDNFSTGKVENLHGLEGDLEIIQGDVRDKEQVKKSVEDIDIVFHEAAFVSNPRSLLQPAECYDINVHGTENLLEASRNAGVKRVVLASSAAVYGNSDGFPLKEESKVIPQTPYAASKFINEIYAGLYTRVFSIEVVSLRYFNVFGPRQSPDSEYAGAIPIFISNLLSKEQITIYGDGKQTRDLIYVDDVVRVNLIAAEHPSATGQVFNICTGIETSVQVLVESLRQLFPPSNEPNRNQARVGDIYRSQGKPDKAREMLDFVPETSLIEGLKKTIEWMRKCQ